MKTPTFKQNLLCLSTIVASLTIVACSGDGSSDSASSSSTTSTSSSSTSSSSYTSSDCSSSSSQGALMTCLATNFLATLSSTEQSSVLYSMTSSNATQHWSNLPVSLVARNGIEFSNLGTSAKTAAETLVNAALNSAGQTSMSEMRAADEYLRTYNSDYGQNRYYISFLGTPSTSSPWILQFSGHHYTFNMAINGSEEVSITPNFVGVEPVSWTDSGGTAHAPMAARRNALLAMLDGLGTTEKATAKLSSAYDDVLVGPQKDGTFPTTQQGIAVSSLSSSQKELVKAAIKSYSDDGKTSQSDTYVTDSALNQTYIAWASYSDLATKGSYVRIDGPRVWIELSVQNGIVLSANHYHSIWRDKTTDYGGNFTF